MKIFVVLLLLLSPAVAAQDYQPYHGDWGQYGQCLGDGFAFFGAGGAFFLTCSATVTSGGALAPACYMSIAAWTASTPNLAYCLNDAERRRKKHTHDDDDDEDDNDDPIDADMPCEPEIHPDWPWCRDGVR